MDKKTFMQTAGEQAKALRSGQMLRVSPTENYYIMRDGDGRLYIGYLTADGETPNFFQKRPAMPQFVNGLVTGWWQKFMPSKAECIAHGTHPALAK